ncbi:MAG: nickel pincer cofactor biosynthesis protein LarB [Halovenus sp.]
MRDVLEALADGELSPAAAEAKLRGYVTSDAGRFDAARTQRSGVPEAILASGKTVEELVTLVEASVETTDRAIGTRLDQQAVSAIRQQLADTHPDASLRFDERSGTLIVHAQSFEQPDLDASVGIVTAGTSDAVPAGEAAAIAAEMGAEVQRVDDIGVASLDRMLDQLPRLREQDVLIVAAGREGALPTVLAGLVDVPIIAVPVSTGYGHGGEGEAALSGMLQSCTALTVVNVDAGFTAGAQAGLIARQLDSARADGAVSESR